MYSYLFLCMGTTLLILSLWGYTPDVKDRLKILLSAGMRIGAEILTKDDVISSGPEELLVFILLMASCISF